MLSGFLLLLDSVARPSVIVIGDCFTLMIFLWDKTGITRTCEKLLIDILPLEHDLEHKNLLLNWLIVKNVTK